MLNGANTYTVRRNWRLTLACPTRNPCSHERYTPALALAPIALNHWFIGNSKCDNKHNKTQNHGEGSATTGKRGQGNAK